jgi:predicted DNA-binding transcriptional regulator AlpA
MTAPTVSEVLTIPEVIREWRIPRATFYRWRQLGKGPKSYKLPNGEIRIRRTDLNEWLRNLEEAV